MIQLSTIAKLPHGAVRPALLAGASPASFALTLGATTLADPAAPAEAAAILLPQRQADAEPGKFLPATSEGETPDAAPPEKDAQDADPDAGALAYAWFPIVQPVLPTAEPAAASGPTEPPIAINGKPAPLLPEAAAPPMPVAQQAQQAEVAGSEATAIAVPLALRATAPAASQGSVAPPLPGAAQSVTPPSAPPQPAPLPPVAAPTPALVASDTPPQRPAVATLGAATDAPTPLVAPPQPAPPHPAPAPLLAAAPLSATDLPLAAQPSAPVAAEPRQPQPAATAVPAPVAAAAPAPEPLVRAAAIEQAFTLVAEPPRAPRREALRDIAPAALATAEAPRVHVAPAAQAGDAMLDLRRREWAGQMVEQIEALRDAAPTRETRIRLAPEALGTVDVSIRHEGDRVHVHFATETPAARQAIAEAQPRLAEIAEARGLKLGQTSVDTGSAGQGSNPQGQGQRAALPRAPARAVPGDTTDTDDRIA
ncbi:flagellar hook-length control protein FliK [Sphingomonas sp. MMS12-HWE2-04]|uniref:flagellar hook-length control protein FliK n=1 Tax=Sphingomonas sp. MMS12-HWE2-04 TaxID=3234199 RepID=UPI00384B33A2